MFSSDWPDYVYKGDADTIAATFKNHYSMEENNDVWTFQKQEQSSPSVSSWAVRLHLQDQTNPRLDWLSHVNESIKCPVISHSCLVSKSPRKEVMPLNREVAAIVDQGRCVFYRVFCGGCYQHSRGGSYCESKMRRSKTNKDKKRDKRGSHRKIEIKNLLKVCVI